MITTFPMDQTNMLKSKEKNNILSVVEQCDSYFLLPAFLPVGASVKAESAPSQENLINMLEDISLCHLPRHIGLVCK